MRRRRGDSEEEHEEPEAPADIGSMLLRMQSGAGNAAVARVLARVEDGEDAGAVLTGERPDAAAEHEELSERERQAVEDRATHSTLLHRLEIAKAHPFAQRIAGELTTYERRLRDAREYGWLGTDAGVLHTELDELESRLERAAREDEAQAALEKVDARRGPLSERAKKAILEHTALDKPGMLVYAPEDVAVLHELHGKLAELQQALRDNRTEVTAARSGLGLLSAPATAFALDAAARLGAGLDKLAIVLAEQEMKLSDVADRHARANAPDRERLNGLMAGLKPELARAAQRAMAGGGSRQEIDYMIKKAWLEQHEQTQRLAKDELWQLVTGFSPREGKVAYFDLPGRMAKFRIHLSLDYGVMRSVGVGDSEHAILDALMGGGAAVTLRSHATAEVLSRSDDRNPRYYHGAGRVTPKREFWETPQGKEVKRNWSANQTALIDAFDAKAWELVKTVHDVLVEREKLKAVVVKTGESLTWAD
jgi:hypothetical protein